AMGRSAWVAAFLLLAFAKEQEAPCQGKECAELPARARRLQAENPWFRIGYDDMQCYAPGGIDMRPANTVSECQEQAEKVGWEFYQFNDATRGCALTDHCQRDAMVKASGWKSWGKNWCVRCGESIWVPKRKLKKCCEARGFARGLREENFQ
ncbi:unnamed protein product, partial [Effrenium voratum]